MSPVFQMPKRIDVDRATRTNCYGRFTAEPFERGFGTTVGNALRRVLLSSLEGAAVISVQIEGVYHEFSAVPGVREDVTDIILNLKELQLKMHGYGPKIITIQAEGEGAVTGADILTDSDIEVLNPDLHIATLNKDGKLNAQMTVKKGRGYVPAEMNVDEEMPAQAIPIDAIFSPVQKVNFIVENARVGRRTDYDKLALEVTTNGSLTPEEAVSQAAQILRDHLEIFVNFKEETRPEMPTVDMDRVRLLENLKRSVDELELSVRSYNCLKNANIRNIGELVQKSEAEMLKTRNFGRKSLNEIKEILETLGLTLGMKLDDEVLAELAKSETVQSEPEE
jgi:DNA-directed RNA polymerase subunit alpha